MSFTGSGKYRLTAGSQFVADLDATGHQILNLADPTVAQNAATKASSELLAWTAIKPPTRLATTSALPAHSAPSAGVLQAVATGALSIDGTAVAFGDRVLVQNEVSVASQNGVYTVTATGGSLAQWILTRAVDSNTTALFQKGFIVGVTDGSVNALSVFMMRSTVSTLDSSAVAFAKISGGGGGGDPRILSTINYPKTTPTSSVIDITYQRVTVTPDNTPGAFAMILPDGQSGQIIYIANTADAGLSGTGAACDILPAHMLLFDGEFVTNYKYVLLPGSSMSLIFDGGRSAWTTAEQGAVIQPQP